MGPWQTCGGVPQTHAASGGGAHPRPTQQWGTHPPCPGLRARVVQREFIKLSQPALGFTAVGK